MDQNRSEDDSQNESYNEFKKNAERKIREDNLKALEDEAWIMGKMNSYIHMARFVDIVPNEEPLKGWRHVLEAYDESDEIFKDYPHPEGTS